MVHLSAFYLLGSDLTTLETSRHPPLHFTGFGSGCDPVRDQQQASRNTLNRENSWTINSWSSSCLSSCSEAPSLQIHDFAFCERMKRDNAHIDDLTMILMATKVTLASGRAGAVPCKWGASITVSM